MTELLIMELFINNEGYQLIQCSIFLQNFLFLVAWIISDLVTFFVFFCIIF